VGHDFVKGINFYEEDPRRPRERVWRVKRVEVEEGGRAPGFAGLEGLRIHVRVLGKKRRGGVGPQGGGEAETPYAQGEFARGGGKGITNFHVL